MDNEITDREAIIETWGEEFAELIGRRRVHFTPDAVIVALKKPVTNSEGQTVSELRIAEPTAAQMQAMDTVKGEVAKGVVLLAGAADMVDSQVLKMAGGDFTLAMEVVGCFLSGGQLTPGT